MLLIMYIKSWFLDKWNNNKNYFCYSNDLGGGEQRDHANDYYFCLTDIEGFAIKNKLNIQYFNIQSNVRPMKHSAEYTMHEKIHLKYSNIKLPLRTDNE